MLRRRRPLLRAAAVGGTAYAVGRLGAGSGKSRRTRRPIRTSASRTSSSSSSSSPRRRPTSSQRHRPATAPAPAQPSMLDQLNQLTDLHQQGALSDEEFTAAKAKLLGG